MTPANDQIIRGAILGESPEKLIRADAASVSFVPFLTYFRNFSSGKIM